MITRLLQSRAFLMALMVPGVIVLTSCAPLREQSLSQPSSFTNDAQEAMRIVSPDGRLAVDFRLTTNAAPRYSIHLDGQPALQESRLGLVRNDADFTKGLMLASVSAVQQVEDDYEILTSKRRLNRYRANRKVFHLETADGRRMDIIFQVSNDGVGFRYVFPETSSEMYRLTDEVSSFRFLPGTKAWLQPMAVAKSGWMETNPSYEEYYEKEIPVGTPSPTGAGWVYPALFCSGDNVWLLVSETALDRNYCGTRLRSESPNGEYYVGFPDPRECFPGGAVNPESTLPWHTPWRIIVVGNLETITESMLGNDLAEPARPTDTRFVPGKASWSWPLLGDEHTRYEVQKSFIDYAAEMRWRYCLIDALWDQQIGHDKIRELIDYAATKDVGILLWYNSAGDWNSTPQTPRNLMLTHQSRVREFKRLKAMGVAGLKIDFFGGDGKSMIAYYDDILRDTARYGFVVNFHGCTLPRGWQRTYPHLMTMEAVRGLEFVTFEQANADRQPSHTTMLPFTRNVFDPMDYTPVVLDQIQRIERRTSSAFELALSVLLTSGIQHYAEVPDGMVRAPEYVRDFLRKVPAQWDDVKFIAGYPGRFVVLAREGDGTWYVAGINGEDIARELSLDLSELSITGPGILITDGDGGSLSFRRRTVHLSRDGMLEVSLQPHGGFVMVFE